MLERIITAILIPALLILTAPFYTQNSGQNVSANGSASTMEAEAKALLKSVLLGIQTDENELIVLTRTAPDEVVAGESFIVTEEIRAKVAIEGAAIVATLPQGLTLVSGDLRGFVGQTPLDGVFTHTYEVKAPDVPGVFAISAIARVKPVEADSVSLTAKDLSVTVVEPNLAPVALFVTSPLNANTLVGETVIFNATTSFDLGGDITDYQWDLGDGTAPTGPDKAIVEHAYTQAGTFRISLVVADGEGKLSFPKFQTVTVIKPAEPEQPKPTQLEQALLVGGAIVAAVGVGYFIWKALLSGDTASETPPVSSSTSTASTPATTSTTAATAAVDTTSIEGKAEDFIRSMRLPLDGVESARILASVTEANRNQWISSLEDESLVILSSQNDILTFNLYPELDSEEQIRVDESFSPLGASSLRELISKRVAPGDTIVEITWIQASGETFQSLAVVSPTGIIKFDTFMTLDP